MTQPIALAIDFGGTSVKLAAIDASSAILARTTFDTASAPGVDLWLDAVWNASRTLLPSLPPGSDFAAVPLPASCGRKRQKRSGSGAAETAVQARPEQRAFPKSPLKP